MTLSEELAQCKTIFIDTTPIIYYIEAHPLVNVKEVIKLFNLG